MDANQELVDLVLLNLIKGDIKNINKDVVTKNDQYITLSVIC